jgi:4-carboxymuconolactone decarboxylase
MRLGYVCLALLGFAVSSAVAQTSPAAGHGDRFMPLKYADLTAEQKALVETYQTKARTMVGGAGPFDIDSKKMAASESSTNYIGVRSPALADSVIKSIYILRGGVVPRRLQEIAVLLTARHWNAQFEWWSHLRQAREAGLGEELITAIAKGQRPVKMQPDVEAVYDFGTELRATRQVSDATFEAVKSRLGSERAVVELMGVMGTYDLISMFHVVDRFPLPDGVKPELLPLK